VHCPSLIFAYRDVSLGPCLWISSCALTKVLQRRSPSAVESRLMRATYHSITEQATTGQGIFPASRYTLPRFLDIRVSWHRKHRPLTVGSNVL
jgi:hypothetical protein